MSELNEMNAEARKMVLRQFLKNSGVACSLGEIVIRGEIGEGANGLVYEGELKGTPVAVKFLVDPHTHKLDRFKAEYLNVLLLPSSGFVATPLLYQEMEIDDLRYPFILLRKYAGHLTRPDKPSLEELARISDFLIRAVSFIHSRGIIHRDLKPENVLRNLQSYVLADFGIASYNPELFKIKADTRKGERLGNRTFSAPEQEEGNRPAHPTMDIYAIGQIIHWFATGSIHRGTKRTLISAHIPGAEPYDHIVEMCLANNPNERFQTADAIRQELEAFSKKGQVDETVDPNNHLWAFREAITATFPKKSYGVVYTDEQQRIDRFISKLSEHNFDHHLWWTDGMRNMYFNFTRLNPTAWLMGDGENGDEIEIRSMWVFVSPSTYGDVVLLNLKAMPRFGVYEDEIDLEWYTQSGLAPVEEAGFVDSEYYVTRAEYDNGYAERNGEVIDLSKHKVAIRTRYVAPYSFFLGTDFHNTLTRLSDSEIRSFHKHHPAGEGITEANFGVLADRLRTNLSEQVLRLL